MVTIQTTSNFFLSLSQNFQSILSNFCLSQNFTSIKYRPLHVLTSEVGAWSPFKPLQISGYLIFFRSAPQISIDLKILHLLNIDHYMFLPLRLELGHHSNHFKFLTISSFCRSDLKKNISIKCGPLLVLTTEVGAWSPFKPL